MAAISETFGEIKPVAKKLSASGLKPQVNAEDKDFLNKLAILEALTQKLSSSSEEGRIRPSVIIVRLSLSSLRQAHQDTPTANAEATDLLAQQLGQFVDAAQKYFGDDVLIATLATEQRSNRQRRDTEARQTEEKVGCGMVGTSWNGFYSFSPSRTTSTSPRSTKSPTQSSSTSSCGSVLSCSSPCWPSAWPSETWTLVGTPSFTA